MRAAGLLGIVLLVGANADGSAVEPRGSSAPLHAAPAIGFSTYLGGLASEDLPRLALGADGSLFIVGSTASPDFPTRAAPGTDGPAGAMFSGDVDVFVAKLDPSGTRLIFSTYLGGSGMDRGAGIAVDDDGAVWITGQTTSPDFPVSEGSFGGAADAFVAKLSADGAEVEFAAFLGGSGVESGTGIALDAAGGVYVVGTTTSPDFPTVEPLQGELGAPADAFVVKLDPDGPRTIYATYLGGDNSDDRGFGIAVDAAGSAYVTGSAGSAFPVVRPAQVEYGGGGDAFVAKLDPSGSSLAYATTLGGSEADAGLAITVDAGGSAYLTGQTASADFPTLSPVQRFPGGGPDAFVTKLAADGQSVIYSTYLGGGGADVGGAIVVDGAGNAYVAGQTSSTDFPTFNPVQADLQGPQDIFISKYCLSLVFPQERELDSRSGADSFSVTTTSGCAWIAFSESPWIELTSPNVVAGSGEVHFAVAPNASGVARAGALNIAGKAVTVTQNAATACDYEVVPASENFYILGGVGRINVTARNDCSWTAVSNASWISLAGPERGTGSGVVSYVVEENRTGRQRSGTITVAGQTFVVFVWLRNPRD